MQSVTATGFSQVLFSELLSFSLTGDGRGGVKVERCPRTQICRSPLVCGLLSYINFYCDCRDHCLQPHGPAFEVLLLVSLIGIVGRSCKKIGASASAVAAS